MDDMQAGRPERTPETVADGAPHAADDRALEALAAVAGPALETLWRAHAAQGLDTGMCTLFLSTCSGAERAHVVTARGQGLADAWRAGLRATRAFWDGRGDAPAWLRVEFACAVKAQTWACLERRLAATKRNYFREGISFDEAFSHAMLAQEIGANALLYDNRFVECRPNAANLAGYGRRRFGAALAWPRDPDTPVWTFSTQGVFADAGGAHVLEPDGRHQGYRRMTAWGADCVRDVAAAATAYLARQVGPSGKYDYGWFPCFDRAIPTYNTLRHASSTYALLEGWELTRAPGHRDAIERALTWLRTEAIHEAVLADGSRAAFLVDVGDEIKLGGNAVCILALCKHAELTGDLAHVPLMERLARGIVYMQDPDSGRFVHVLHHPGLGIKASQRTIYYDGEATFALMRLYGLTREPRWLAAVEKAFDHFIAARHWRAHDHWLGYCVNELTLYRPEERYFRFGLDNVRGHLDFVLERITTYPTLLELMMAAQKMIARLQADPRHAHLLDGFDLARFRQALEYRARYLLSGFFWPELAMFFANPRRIVDGFFIRHHSFRVRIDDVEHYLSGYVAYWKHLVSARARLPGGPVRAGETRGGIDGGRERILFLQDDLREVGNGIEVAGIRRAALFRRRLGLVPWILTAAFSPGLRRTEARLKQAGLLPEDVRLLNIHDWVAEMGGDGRLQPLAQDPPPPADAARARAGALLRLRWETREAGERLRREDYALEDGRCFLRRESVARNGVFELRRILVRLPGGRERSFVRERDFVHAMVVANLGRDTFWHLIVDRNRTYRGLLQNDIRAELRCSVSAVIHSTHLLPDGSRKGSYWYPLHRPGSCDRLIVLTRQQHADLLDEGVPAERMQVIPHWLDPFPQVDPGQVPAAPRVVYFARYSPEKRHALLLRAFAAVVRRVPGAQLHTFGAGPLKQWLRDWVEAQGLSASIVIHDFVHDIAAEYRQASLGVLPSSEEGFSLAGLESLAYGCPLVAFAVRYGPRDLLEDSDAGVLVTPGDEAALADAIATLLEDPERLARLRQGARASASRFTADQACGWWQAWWAEMQALAGVRASGPV